MASPFHAFRKHQRVLLVVVGVICIITFTVGDFILSYFPMGGGGSAEANTVVTWKGGELNENELVNLRRLHRLTLDYLDRVAATTVERGGSPKGAGISRDQAGRITEPGIPRDDSDLRLVRTLLLAEEAEKIGMEVPDEAIYAFLAELSDRMLSSEELRNILKETRGQLTRDQLFDHLRREMIARNYMRLMVSGDVMTPEDAWSYYNRLSRRVTTSILAFPAEEHLDQAPQPSKAEVQELYEKYKDQYDFPASPEPGFKQRPKYKFAYFKADRDKFIEEEKAKISSEEVQKYYDEHKESYKVPELPASKPDASSETSDTTETTDDAKTPDLTPPANPAPPASEGKSETPADEAASTTPQQNASEKAPAEAEKKPPSPEEGASLSRATFPVAFLAQEEDAGPESKPAPQKEAARKSESATQSPAAKPEAPAADPEKTASSTGEPSTEKKAGEDTKEAPAKEEAATAKEPKYQPLSEVEDDIRRILAAPQARERMDDALGDAQRQVQRYKKAVTAYQAAVQDGREAREPQRPNFQEIADELGLQYGETPLVDQLTVGETELGQTFIFGPGFQQYSFAQVAMGEQATLYQAERISSLDDYLYWTVEFKEARTPPLDEIRDEVVRAWRLQKAFEIAAQQAEKAARQVRKASADAPLDEAAGVKEAEVIRPPAFSWMTQGATPFGGGAPYMSDVQGVENPGDEFMKAVFSLQKGEVAVAPNQPKTIAYLVRLDDETPTEEDRRNSFWETGIQFNMNLHYVAQMAQRERILAWLAEFEKEWSLDWKREPRTYAG
jgi:hypothetical protein